jgi:ATP-binding cassette subfamily C (CFTR/MRP) protein 4
MFYRYSSRDLKREEGISRSPVYAFINASLQGLTTIRAYNASKTFENRFQKLVIYWTSDIQLENT